MKLPRISLIVAFDTSLGIGLNNRLPWNIKNEMEFFKQYTSNPSFKNTVIMGYNTWESIPNKNKPLKNRKNIILTRNCSKINTLYETYNNPKQLECYSSIDEMLDTLKCYSIETQENSKCLEINENIYYIIGGKHLYEAFLLQKEYNKYLYSICISRIDKDYTCDTFFPFDPKKIPSLYNNVFTFHYNGYDTITKTNVHITNEVYINKSIII